MLIRCSSLGKIMADATMPPVTKVRKSTRKPKDENDAKALEAEHKAIDDDFNARYNKALIENQKALSAGAKTYCKELAKQFVYQYSPDFSSKAMQKGIICEDLSIELYNDVFFTNYTKNTLRKENEWISGECDIDGSDRIIDIKSSWSLQTFPAFTDDAHDSGYEWQGRGYMMLWNKDIFELAYCLVTTPDELIGYESAGIHVVDHIPPELRVTSMIYDRDKSKENLIKIKVESARKYIEEQIEQITKDHK